MHRNTLHTRIIHSIPICHDHHITEEGHNSDINTEQAYITAVVLRHGSIEALLLDWHWYVTYIHWCLPGCQRTVAPENVNIMTVSGPWSLTRATVAALSHIVATPYDVNHWTFVGSSTQRSPNTRRPVPTFGHHGGRKFATLGPEHTAVHFLTLHNHCSLVTIFEFQAQVLNSPSKVIASDILARRRISIF